MKVWVFYQQIATLFTNFCFYKEHLDEHLPSTCAYLTP